MSQTEVCVLDDGRRVKYRVDWRKPRSTYQYVYFVGPDGKRRELSTNETNQRRAKDAALALIVQEYRPQVFFQAIGWDAAIDKMVEQMRAGGLRPNTISTYQTAIQTFRKLFPNVKGPGSVTAEMGKRYKAIRMTTESPHTVLGDLRELRAVFGKWLGSECGLLTANPFAEVEPPKVDELEPRIVKADERLLFETWLSSRWDGWRTPLLFLETMAAIGCRIRELAETPTRNLADGRITFEAMTAKGRRTRRSKLPAPLFEELRAIAGPRFLFERFPDEQREVLLKRGRKHQAKRVTFPYDPGRLVGWMQDRLCEFREEHPEIPWFKLHNYRGTAMSRARQAGVAYADAAIAFGCNPETMRRHYEKLDEVEISDTVMDVLHGVE